MPWREIYLESEPETQLRGRKFLILKEVTSLVGASSMSVTNLLKPKRTVA